MKMLVFLIVTIVVASLVFWRVRKADAERTLARQNELHRKQGRRKKAVTPARPVEWPVIIRPAGKLPTEKDKQVPEPSMTAIKFKHVDLHDASDSRVEIR